MWHKNLGKYLADIFIRGCLGRQEIRVPLLIFQGICHHGKSYAFPQIPMNPVLLGFEALNNQVIESLLRLSYEL